MLDDWNVSTRHVHGHDFDLFSDLSRVAVEIIFDGILAIVFEEGDEFPGLKILSDKSQFPLVPGKFVPR